MIEFLISSATVVCLAGCVYAAYLILFQARSSRTAGARKFAKTQAYRHTEPDFRNPSLDYYI
jgi:hypothetical protein